MAPMNDFIKKYLHISLKAFNSENKQPIQLGIFRNDYMMDKIKNFIFQIEYNTIAAGGAFFADGAKKFFAQFSKKYPELYDRYYKFERNSVPYDIEYNIDKITDSMWQAIVLFEKIKEIKTIVLFVVQENEINIYDQRAISNKLYDK